MPEHIALLPGSDGFCVTLLQAAPASLVQVAKEKAEKEKEEEAEHGPGDSKSFFHGKKEVDPTGKKWLDAPKGLKAENEYCYLPKRWIHTWSGHTKVPGRLCCASSAPCCRVPPLSGKEEWPITHYILFCYKTINYL